MKPKTGCAARKPGRRLPAARPARVRPAPACIADAAGTPLPPKLSQEALERFDSESGAMKAIPPPAPGGQGDGKVDDGDEPPDRDDDPRQAAAGERRERAALENLRRSHGR